MPSKADDPTPVPLGSRGGFSLTTDPTGTKPDDYYDEVCALSEKAINQNFERLFQMREKISLLTFWDGDEYMPRIEAKMDHPKVILDFNNTVDPALLFQLRIKEGKIYLNSGDAKGTDLSGWEITVAAALSKMNASNDPEAPATDKSAFKALTKTHEFLAPIDLDAVLAAQAGEALPEPVKMQPGDYSLTRLFASISCKFMLLFTLLSARPTLTVCDCPAVSWGLPLDEWTTCPGPNNTRMKLDTWASLNDDNQAVYSRVKLTLTDWAAHNRTSAFFTLGLEVNLPKPQDSETATYSAFYYMPLRDKAQFQLAQC